MAVPGFLPPDLREFAELPLSVNGKNTTISGLIYSSYEDFWTTGVVSVDANGDITDNTSVRLFQSQIGEQGQGWTVACTSSQTNNTNGSRFQGNEVYIMTHLGFEFYTVAATGGGGASDLDPIISTLADKDTAGADAPLSTSDIQKMGLGFFWTHQLGAGPERAKGLLIQYPFGAGVYGAGLAASDTTTAGSAQTKLYESGAQNGGPNVPMRKLPLPVLFLPNIETIINAKCGTGPDALSSQSSGVAILAYGRGYRMTVPV